MRTGKATTYVYQNFFLIYKLMQLLSGEQYKWIFTNLYKNRIWNETELPLIVFQGKQEILQSWKASLYVKVNYSLTDRYGDNCLPDNIKN